MVRRSSSNLRCVIETCRAGDTLIRNIYTKLQLEYIRLQNPRSTPCHRLSATVLLVVYKQAFDAKRRRRSVQKTKN